MEGHTALPDVENLDGALEVAAEVIKEHITQASADHHPEDEEEQQVVEIVRGHPQFFLLRETLQHEVPGDERDHVHQAVPAKLDSSEMQKYGVDIRELKLEHHAVIQGVGTSRRARFSFR